MIPAIIQWVERPAQRARRHPLLGYFVLAFGVTWAWHTVFLGVLELPFESPVMGIGAFAGPTLAAFVMAGLADGRPGVRGLLRAYVAWRASPWWYLVAIAGLPVLFLLVMLALQPAAIGSFRPPTTAFLISALGLYPHILLLGGPLAEEPGWRGFALPRLERRFGPLPGTLLLGALHAAWHLPLYLYVPGYNMAPPEPVGTAVSFAVFSVGIAGLTVIFTWMYNSTGGGLPLMILLHASVNTAGLLPTLFPDLAPEGSDVVRTVALVGVAVLLAVVTRGRLAWPRAERHRPGVPDRAQPRRTARSDR
ncbi:CPBP family intramembrane metalloprotease [Streptomonospora sp. S1-112]|uniref:CPBP family intramembrane metalloprotease n=1 Tax=Streptomonospora mangrovi TaxID=2883123 RepID=A0A9X3NHJ4_9ACTN|nr:type II CAAX endopeptidase family protein [Streptomonospora mangrovi]MDA0563140.1 CPBP family intramembrane metalloprotease [Streptomonospora mangrovi]